MKALCHRGILATRTVRMNRRGLPKELCSPKPKTPEDRKLANKNILDPGEFTYRFYHPCAVIKWQDTKEVFVLSTTVNPYSSITCTFNKNRAIITSYLTVFSSRKQRRVKRISHIQKFAKLPLLPGPATHKLDSRPPLF